MGFWRVDNATEGTATIVEADDPASAVKVYLETYPPDLYVTEADDDDLAEWKAHGRDLIWES